MTQKYRRVGSFYRHSIRRSVATRNASLNQSSRVLQVRTARVPADSAIRRATSARAMPTQTAQLGMSARPCSTPTNAYRLVVATASCLAEGCDDGNSTNGDGCSAQCLLELGEPCMTFGSCESDFCDPAGNICACDADADCPNGQLCDTASMPNLCVNPGCGIGVLEASEGCDDSNTMDGDGCSSACKKELKVPCVDATECGSGNCDGTTNTCQCDINADCATGEVCNTNTDPNACVMAGCGNGVVEAGEGCDDGNMTEGDGCTAMCTKDFGQTCTDGTECGSGNCDGTKKVCACDADKDCAKDQICDVKADPHACVPPMGCTSDADCSGGLFCDEPSAMCVECTADAECKDRKDKKNLCDEVNFSCVECVMDDDCPNGGTCEAAKHECEAAPIIVEGSGILRTTSTTNDNNVPFALFGLLALGMMRRRRHGSFVLPNGSVARSTDSKCDAASPRQTPSGTSVSEFLSVWPVPREFAADVHARKNRPQSFLHPGRYLSEDAPLHRTGSSFGWRLQAVSRRGLGAVSGVDRDSNA